MDVGNLRKLLQRLYSSPLNSPVRLGVMLLLAYRGEAEFNELQKVLGVTAGTLWTHLTKLREQGLVKFKRKFSGRGPRLVIAITTKGIEEFSKYMTVLKQVINFAEISEGDKSEGKE